MALPSTRADQLPPGLAPACIAGDPFTLIIVPTGATLTDPVLSLYLPDSPTPLAAPADANLLPTVSLSPPNIEIVFTAANTAAIGDLVNDEREMRLEFNLRALTDGDGPFSLIAGVLRVLPASSFTTLSQTQTVTLEVTPGDVTVELAVTVGGGGSGDYATAAQGALADTALQPDDAVFTPQVAPDYFEGRVFYDSVSKALSYYNEEPDVTVNLGQENLIRVRNSTGATILNGQAVYISGSQGSNLPRVSLAQADVVTTARTIGLATHDIENNTEGYITTLGQVRELDTSMFTASAALFLSTTTAGGLTMTRPTTGFAVVVGYVTIAHPNAGEIKVLSGTSVQEATIVSTENVAAAGAVMRSAATTAQLNDDSSTVNTENKYAGALVFNTTLSRPVWATGAAAASPWNFADGTTAHTPV